MVVQYRRKTERKALKVLDINSLKKVPVKRISERFEIQMSMLPRIPHEVEGVLKHPEPTISERVETPSFERLKRGFLEGKKEGKKEDISDVAFEKRHSKYETMERKQKKWDNEWLRHEKHRRTNEKTREPESCRVLESECSKVALQLTGDLTLEIDKKEREKILRKLYMQ
jgi:hypothetical protein